MVRTVRLDWLTESEEELLHKIIEAQAIALVTESWLFLKTAFSVKRNYDMLLNHSMNYRTHWSKSPVLAIQTGNNENALIQCEAAGVTMCCLGRVQTDITFVLKKLLNQLNAHTHYFSLFSFRNTSCASVQKGIYVGVYQGRHIREDSSDSLKSL